MLHPEANNNCMLEFLKLIEKNCRPALLDCTPVNSDHVSSYGTLQGTDLRSVDCRVWTPEMPRRIGLYHAYLRGYNRDVRTHKLFLVCSGCLEKACDEFCNLLIDVAGEWTARDVCVSEEAWWLRRACCRSRCRLLKQLADAYGLHIPTVQDIQANEQVSMAIPCTDTVEFDMAMCGETVSVFNRCCDTLRPFNGMLVQMHTGEGMWMFRGARRAGGFGSSFGDSKSCGAFPCSQPPERGPRSVLVQTPDYVVSLNPSRSAQASYMCFDEAYFKTLERMQWDRNNGYVELMPIVTGVP